MFFIKSEELLLCANGSSVKVSMYKILLRGECGALLDVLEKHKSASGPDRPDQSQNTTSTSDFGSVFLRCKMRSKKKTLFRNIKCKKITNFLKRFLRGPFFFEGCKIGGPRKKRFSECKKMTQKVGIFDVCG